MARTTVFSTFSLALVIAAGCTGEDGISYLTDVSDEPAGANCAAGGVRIDNGPDANRDGTLGTSEIENTHFVCAGGVSTLTDVTPEPVGDNCSAGGVKIETGPDTNRDGSLDASEVVSTSYACGAGEAQIRKAFDGSAAGIVANTNAPVDLLSVEITTTTSGNLLAIGSADIYCTLAQCPAGNPAASGYLWISDGANVNAPAAEYDYLFMQPQVSESLTRTAHFPIAAAGTYTFKLRGEDDVAAFTFYRSGLTLVFLP